MLLLIKLHQKCSEGDQVGVSQGLWFLSPKEHKVSSFSCQFGEGCLLFQICGIKIQHESAVFAPGQSLCTRELITV